jgi:exopolysaccharide production protein ExoQ
MSVTLTFPASTRTELEKGDPSLFHRVRTWWLLLALFLMAQGNGLFTRQDRSYWHLKEMKQTLETSPAFLLLTCVLWVICVGLMLTSIGPTVRTMLNQKAILAFALLAFLSTLWSQDPLLTFRKAVLLFLLFTFAWFFATYYSPADQMRLLFAAGVIVALASIAMAILLPQYGISWEGEWKGVFGQKNRMGLSMVFLFAGLPFCPIPSGRRLLTLALQAILPIGLILLSQSKTSLILAVVLIVVRVFGPYIARRRKEQLPFVLFGAVCGIVLVTLVITIGREIILPLLGRESTLTGRTEHWALLSTYAYRHLWLGYGYEAFWTATGDSLRVITAVGAGMKGADSGYVDTMLQFGLVGLGLLFLILLVCVRNFVKLLRRVYVPLIAYWYAGIILAIFVGSLTEGLFLIPTGITSFIFVVACAGLRDLTQKNASSTSRSDSVIN